MVKRDSFGIICQHSLDDPHYLDGGDSASRTAIMAICGSDIDKSLIPKFEFDGLMVRHPIQEPWNNHKNCTRDQLIPYITACWSIGRHDIVRRLFVSHLKRVFFCQNSEHDKVGTKKKFPAMPDVLMPSHILHFILCGKLKHLYFVLPILYPFHFVDLFWNCYVQPNREQNQFWCMTLVAGTNKLYIKLYGRNNFLNHIANYWGGWRDQLCIASEMFNKTKDQ